MPAREGRRDRRGRATGENGLGEKPPAHERPAHALPCEGFDIACGIADPAEPALAARHEGRAVGERGRGSHVGGIHCGDVEAEPRAREPFFEERGDGGMRAARVCDGLRGDRGGEVDPAIFEPHDPRVATAADGHHEFAGGEVAGRGREREPDADPALRRNQPTRFPPKGAARR